jgi:hypothetical protein
MIIALIMVAAFALIFSNYQCENKLRVNQKSVQRLIRQSADLSIKASGTINPILALVDAIQAEQTLVVLRTYFSPDKLDRWTNMDTEHMMNVINEQRITITNDVMRAFPNFIPEHPLINESMLTPRNNVPNDLIYMHEENM